MPSSRLRRIALFLIIVVAQGFLFEAGLRLYGGSEAAPVFQTLFMQDARIGHRPRPGARVHYRTSEFATDIAINAAGVRGAEIGPRRAGERRIVVLGDSLVLAVQVQQDLTFCHVLEQRLNARHDGMTYRVINAGVQGYGPVEELLFFDHVVASLQPDIVLVSVFVANDASEALVSRPKLDANRPTVERAREDAVGWARRLVRRSVVLQTLRQRYDAVRNRVNGPGVAQRPLVAYLTDPPPEVEEGVELTRQVFGRLQQRATGAGARTAFVLVPARFQLDPDDYARLSAIVAESGASLDRQAATRRFAAALAPLDAPTLDLLPILATQEDPVGLFFRENIHFTVRGHRVVAAALERFLDEAGLLQSGDRARVASRTPAP